MAMLRYIALNGTRKIVNLDRMDRIPGDDGELQIRVARHCGGLLIIRILSSGSGVEITEAVLRERLKQTGATLPWERSAA